MRDLVNVPLLILSLSWPYSRMFPQFSEHIRQISVISGVNVVIHSVRHTFLVTFCRRKVRVTFFVCESLLDFACERVSPPVPESELGNGVRQPEGVDNNGTPVPPGVLDTPVHGEYA